MSTYVMLSTLSESGRKVLRGRPGWIRKVNADVQRMGARVVAKPTGERLGEPVGRLEVEASALVATTIVPDEGMIDEIPVLAVAAAFADGLTEIRGVAELRVK